MTRKKNRLDRYKRHAAAGRLDKLKSNDANMDTHSQEESRPAASGATTRKDSVSIMTDILSTALRKSVRNAGSGHLSVDEIEQAWQDGICVHCGSSLKGLGLYFMQARQSVQKISVSISILARKNGEVQIIQPGRIETEEGERITTVALGSLQCAIEMCESQMCKYLDEIKKRRV